MRGGPDCRYLLQIFQTCVFYPSALKCVGRLTALAVQRIARLAILKVARRFQGMGASTACGLRWELSYARVKEA
jgi:hypothetical protein